MCLKSFYAQNIEIFNKTMYLNYCNYIIYLMVSNCNGSVL